MIELTPNTALMLYLTVTLVLIFGIWCFQIFYKPKKKFEPMGQELCVCEFCHFVYLNNQVKKINQCPQCNSYNIHNQFSK